MFRIFIGPICALLGGMAAMFIDEYTLPDHIKKIIAYGTIAFTLFDFIFDFIFDFEFNLCAFIGFILGILMLFVISRSNFYGMLLIHDMMEGVFVSTQTNLFYLFCFTIHDAIEAFMMVYLCRIKVANNEIDKKWLHITSMMNPIAQLFGGILRIYLMTEIGELALELIDIGVRTFVASALVLDLFI